MDLLESIDERGIAWLTLNRVDRRNSLDDELIISLTTTLRCLDARDDVRVLVLTGNGPVFCAGVDIKCIRRFGERAWDENTAGAGALGRLLRLLDTFSKPTIALAQGAAFGGGVGLVACCDIAIASERASFSLSEVKLGIIPALVGPYVARAMSVRQARRYMLSAEEISAQEALRIGLIHQIVPHAELSAHCERTIKALLLGGPNAQREVKALVANFQERPIDDELMAECAQRLAERRASAEGREGLSAFLEKRPPSWRVFR